MGLGYIGLPTAIIAAAHGVKVRGVDINPDIVAQTNAGHLHIVEPGLGDMLRDVTSDGRLQAYTTPAEADAFFIVVPTPFKAGHQPDVAYVEAATRAVVPYLRPGNLFVIESTSPVGTTEAMAEVIYAERPELKGKIHIAYCPERVLPGNVIHELVHNDRVIGGIDEESTRHAQEFYGQFVQGKLWATNARTAEMCKRTENASRDVQIAFANELSLICDRAGINVWELVQLATRHPRVNILNPGCGVGGHCIAVDPYFISAMFPEEAKMIAQAREVNNHKADWCATRVLDTIAGWKASRPGERPVVAMMGLAFKPDIDALRESPSRHIVDAVKASGVDAELLVAEPNVADVAGMELTPYEEAYRRADIVVMLTGHTPFRQLPYPEDKAVLDFCGIWKR